MGRFIYLQSFKDFIYFCDILLQIMNSYVFIYMLHYDNCCSIPALLIATQTRFQNIDEHYMLHLQKVLFNSIYFVILNNQSWVVGCIYI